MKNNKGITMISLVITLIVMTILIAVTVNTGSRVIKEAQLQDIVTNMLLIEAKVKIAIEEVNFETANLDPQNDAGTINKVKEKLIGNLIDNTKVNNVTFTQYFPEGKENNEWYVLTNEELIEIGLNQSTNINEQANYYIYTYTVNEETSETEIEIVYTGGYIHSDGKVYYALSDLERLQNSYS